MPTPRWELHIRPMFNLQDWEHMKFRFDVTDINSVWAFRSAILGRLKSPDPMPPKAESGPWPEEWIDLFERWITEGETEFGGTPPRLTLGKGEGYQLTPGFGRWRLSGTAKSPPSGSKVWLHLVAFSETSQTLTIYVESPPDAAGVEPDRPILGMITATPLLQEVIVIDANGEIRLPRPGPGV